MFLYNCATIQHYVFRRDRIGHEAGEYFERYVQDIFRFAGFKTERDKTFFQSVKHEIDVWAECEFGTVMVECKDWRFISQNDNKSICNKFIGKVHQLKPTAGIPFTLHELADLIGREYPLKRLGNQHLVTNGKDTFTLLAKRFGYLPREFIRKALRYAGRGIRYVISNVSSFIFNAENPHTQKTVLFIEKKIGNPVNNILGTINYPSYPIRSPDDIRIRISLEPDDEPLNIHSNVSLDCQMLDIISIGRYSTHHPKNGRPIGLNRPTWTTMAQMSTRDKDNTSSQEVKAASKKKYKHTQVRDRTKEEYAGRKCVTCGKNGTQIAHFVDGRERWHQLNEEATEFVCHGCMYREVGGAKKKSVAG